MVSMLKNKLLKGKTISLLLWIIFIVASVWFISPTIRKTTSQYHSSQLKKITVKDETTERTDYVNESGIITVAANLGYATIIYTKTDKGRIERYYDDKEEPVRAYSGYYGVLREYDENGSNIQNTYLDMDNKPVMTASGYAIMKREYNENKKLVAIRYYDTAGNPVITPSSSHGKTYEYDENGMNVRTVFINVSGAPMMSREGYAIIVYHRYTTEGPDYGRVESEFYFDEHGDPICLALGQYGVHIEYDEKGRESVWTYLDADGNPIVTNKGYTTVQRTFQADNYVASERYFDLNGNPYSLSEGQYGIKVQNGATIHLNQNGEEQFNLKALLYNHSWLAVVLALIAVLISVLFNRKWNVVFLLLYICAIAYLTLLFRENEGEQLNIQLFWSYRRIFTDSETRADILRNIWLFIPFGAILYGIYPKKSMLFVPVVVSIVIETVQYITGTGLCELDDVINNSLGGCIGFYAGQLATDLIQRIKKRGHSYPA